MGRGGKRPGAGRPPILDWEARGWIGAECERLLKQETVKQSERKFRDQNPTIDNIYDLFADNEALSIEDRRSEDILKELKASRDDLNRVQFESGSGRIEA